MTAHDQQLRFQTGRYLHNDLPRIAHAHDRADRHPLRAEGRHVSLEFVDHERIRPP